MLFRPYKKRSAIKTVIHNEKSVSQTGVEQENLHNDIKITAEAVNNTDEFLVHISRYIGQTVSIFVKGGGMLGSGFTGILLSVCEDCIVLITRIGLAPACSLGNSCSLSLSNIYQTKSPYYFSSITAIPVNKIACFVHNLT